MEDRSPSPLPTLSVLAAIAAVLYLFMSADRPVPSSFAAGGLPVDAKWSPEQRALAVDITRKVLLNSATLLDDASRKGDAKTAIAIGDFVLPVLRGWNIQEALGAENRNCSLAAAHLADGILSVSSGGAFLSKSRFEAALNDCR